MNKRHIVRIAAVLLLFVPLPFLFPKDDLFTLLDAVAVSVGCGVLSVYMVGAAQWLWALRTTVGYLLVLGIVATWLSLVGRISWLWLWRVQGRPDEFFDHWFVALTIYLAIVGGVLHLAADRAIENRVPPSGWVVLILAVVVGLVLGTTLIVWT